MCRCSSGREDGSLPARGPPGPGPRPGRFAAPLPHRSPEGRPAGRPPALRRLRRARRLAVSSGRAVGIHVNFAPDADVNNNPANPIINTRSFGEDPRAVSRLVAEYVRGLRDHGMLATLKHFPGHGDTQIDSHIGLPRIAASYGRLDSLELVPFRAGISAGADVVMSAHIVVPDLTGPEQPATLAAAVLTGLLRDSLGFQGLVVTDALDMGSIVSKYGAGEAAVRAFLAGADLLVIPADPDSAAGALIAAVASGRIATARLDASVRRDPAARDRGD